MKGVIVKEYGGPDVMEMAELPMPKAKPGWIVVKVAYVGINFKDIYLRTGVYKDRPAGPSGISYKPQFPFTLGLEASGTVVERGEGVDDVMVGDRVAFQEGIGAYAEFVAVPAWRCTFVPEGVSMQLAAATQLQGSTAHYLCHGFVTLGPESSCLVHAAAGGVGHILVQLAKRQGARVFATVGSPEKAAFAKSLGANEIIDYGHENFLEIVKEKTDGRGVDIVWDSVGIATIHDSIKCARIRGHCILYGSVSGQVHEIAPLELGAAGSVLFTRSHLEYFTRNAEEVRMRANDIYEGIKSGWLRSTIRVLPFAEYAEAQRVLQTRENKGKILLEVAGSD